MARNLQSRAREHIFADPGTAGLALDRYEDLHKYEWCFYFLELERFPHEGMNQKILLNLGEQLIRHHIGWPILCAEWRLTNRCSGSAKASYVLLTQNLRLFRNPLNSGVRRHFGRWTLIS